MLNVFFFSRGVKLSSAFTFFLPFVVALVLAMALPGQAQTPVTGGVSEQLLQMYQQRNGQFDSGVIPSYQQQPLPPDVTLQPSIAPSRPLPPSRLEQIMSARAGAKLQLFGYNLLGSGRAVTIPQTGAVQDDYVLGPGDEIVVSLRGQENSEVRAIVDRNGQVVLPRLSPVAASGLTFGSFRDDLQAKVHRAYVATNAFVTIARVRQISVLVSGEVNVPGQRQVSGLSSAVDALLLAGGVRKNGSLRNIRVERGSQRYVVDLYNILASGGAGHTMRLADGDRIVVPPLGPTVAVTGLVRQPGIFELPGHQSQISVRALLNLAGGEEVRGRYRLSAMRIMPDGRSQLVPLSDDKGVVRDSEILFVQLGANQAIGQATLSGVTGLAGQYPISEGSKLSDILRAPGAMGDAPYTLFGLVVRKDPRTLLRTLQAFTPVAVLNGGEDQQLHTDDVVRVLSLNEVQLLNYVMRSYLSRLSQDQANIRNPLGAPDNNSPNPGVAQQQGTGTPNASNPNARPGQVQTASQAFNASQQDDTGVSTDTVVGVSSAVQRAEVTALLDVTAPGAILPPQRQQQQVDTDPQNASGVQQDSAGAPGSVQNGGVLSSQGQTMSNNPARAAALGSFSQQGQNGLFSGATDNSAQPPAANYVDQYILPEQYAGNREVHTFGELARQLGVDPLVLMSFLVDSRAHLDGAVRGPGSYLVGPHVALSDLVQAAGGTASWADESGVELISTAVDGQQGRSATQRVTLPLRQGTLASYIVRPRDQLRFNKVFTDVGIGSVAVQGEVRFIGNYPILRGEHLSELLARAGGLTSTAYPAGTVFLRKSAAQVEREGYQRAAREIEDQLVVAMTRIGNDKVDPATFASLQSFVTELRNQKALGRISIAADPSLLASRPDLDPLLEAGDVVYIPQRPSTVSVLGQVMQPGSYAYRAGKTMEDYIRQAGGTSNTADSSETFIVLPDGSAHKAEKSLLGFEDIRLPPGSAVVVPRDVTPLDTRQVIIDVSSILSQLAVSVASLAVISRY